MQTECVKNMEIFVGLMNIRKIGCKIIKKKAALIPYHNLVHSATFMHIFLFMLGVMILLCNKPVTLHPQTTTTTTDTKLEVKT